MHNAIEYGKRILNNFIKEDKKDYTGPQMFIITHYLIRWFIKSFV